MLFRSVRLGVVSDQRAIPFVLSTSFMNKTQDTYMLKIVTNPRQSFDNIEKFNAEIKKTPELQARLAYARSWYARQDQSGTWLFAPSKFVGYQDIDGQTYLEAEDADGRRTEAQLQGWFNVVDPATPLYDELNSKLVAFLAQYGKAPSTKTQISVERERRRLSPDTTSDSATYDAVASLMVGVAKRLPTKQFASLRSQLEIYGREPARAHNRVKSAGVTKPGTPQVSRYGDRYGLAAGDKLGLDPTFRVAKGHFAPLVVSARFALPRSVDVAESTKSGRAWCKQGCFCYDVYGHETAACRTLAGRVRIAVSGTARA